MKKTYWILLMMLIAMICLMSAPASVFAVTACPEPFPFTQPNGALISVQLYGDEFLSWTEDNMGNLIIFDEALDGYCYAEWTDDGAVSTGNLVGAGIVMLRGNISRHKIPQAVIDRAIETREIETAAFEEALTFNAIDALSEIVVGSPPIYTPIELMTRKMLIIHITWEDRSTILATNGTVMTKLTGQQIYDLNFGLKGEVRRSVNGYFQDLLMADEAVILPAEVLKPMDGCQGVIEIQLPGRHPHAYNNSTTHGNIMREALIKACAEGYLNLAPFDTNNNGNIETAELAIGFITDGFEAAILGTVSPSVWGVSMSSTPTAAQTNGKKVASIFGQGAYHRRTNNIPNDMLTTGIIAHEMGHSGYSFNDTYDYGTLTGSSTAAGHGYWSLQTQGSWARKTGESSGATPGFQDAYNLVRSGIVLPGVAYNGESVEMNNHLDIYLAQTPITTPFLAAPATHPYGTRYAGQYFLMQQRKYGDVDNYDQGAFASISSTSNVSHGGLMIFHNDMAVTLSRINDKPGHYRSAIEEAHGGVQNMQQTTSAAGKNNGGLTDLWGVSRFEFSHFSDPISGTYLYDDGRYWVSTLNPKPHQNTPSGVTLTNIVWNPATLSTTYMMGYNALPPVIDVQPEGATVIVGTAHEMFVEASIPPNNLLDKASSTGELSYQWYCDGAFIAGADEAAYTAANNVPGFYDYFVEVTNTIPDNEDGAIKAVTVASDIATMEVLFKVPEITTGNGQANLNFDIVSANGKGYTLFLSTDGGESFAIYKDVNYNAKGAHVKSVTNGKTYFAYIEYNDGKGYFCRSEIVGFTPSK